MLRGGVAASVAAAVAACRDKRDVTDTEEADISLLRTASSLEVLAVQTYDKFIVSGVLTTPATMELVTLLRDHHDHHADRLRTATEDAGGDAYGNPNPFAQERAVDPVLPSVKDEPSAIALARTIETMIAETYAVAAGVLSAPDLRQAIMAIGATEARHVAALDRVTAQPVAADAFLKTDAALGPQAYV